MQDRTTVRVTIISPMFGLFNKAIDINLEGQPLLDYREEVKEWIQKLSCMGEDWVSEKMRTEDRISPIEEVINEIGMVEMRNRLKKGRKGNK